MNADVGDRILIDSHLSSDSGRRQGTVVAVLGEGVDEHYRIRWEDGHESIFFPGADAHVEGRRD